MLHSGSHIDTAFLCSSRVLDFVAGVRLNDASAMALANAFETNQQLIALYICPYPPALCRRQPIR